MGILKRTERGGGRGVRWLFLIVMNNVGKWVLVRIPCSSSNVGWWNGGSGRVGLLQVMIYLPLRNDVNDEFATPLVLRSLLRVPLQQILPPSPPV